ncbi:phage minor head protein [Methanobrevibacter sp.]|uniref:phage minor head protein n=1 Tax=Methanobrevibacter sp. TaxID=66852 RepID=UPI0025FADF98|nr:phage minor head protein [Methanobrevibacter sp.]MBQ2832249.1 hypothetical protein [Methanobrevibacter sp.]
MSILKEKLVTNHMLLDYFDMWDEFDITKVEDPKTIRYYDLIMNLLDSQIDASIRWLESEEARDYFFGEAEYQVEVFQSLEDEWDSILEGKYPSVEALLNEVYRRGKAKGYTDMREHIKYTEADKQAIKIARDYNYHLISKIDNDTRIQIKNKINEAVIAGEHPYTVAPKILSIAGERLEGSNFTPRQRATMIARTEISRVQNTGILQSYINEGYIEVKLLTAEDNNVCQLCLRYAFEFNDDDNITFANRGEERVHNIIKLIKNGKFPPFHPLCRCTYLSVWESKGEPPEEPYIVDLTPLEFKDLSNHRYTGEFMGLDPSKIPSEYPIIIKDNMLGFDQYVRNGKWKSREYGYVINLTTGKVSDYVTNYEENHVTLSSEHLSFYKNNDVFSAHSHISLEPFNFEDFYEALKNEDINMKGMMVHTPKDIFIVEFGQNAKNNVNDIVNAAYDDYKNMMQRKLNNPTVEFGAEALWDNYLNNEVLNKYMSFRRVSKDD